MEQIILILLGSFLAILGGFINQWYQNWQNQKNEDYNLLVQALDILLLFKRIIESSGGGDLPLNMDKLYQISFKIRTKKYKMFRLEIRDFARDNRELYAGSDLDLYNLGGEIEPIISKLEKEIKD